MCAVALYDDFNYLYHCIIGELYVFDSNGNLRKRQQAEDGIKGGLALIEELDHCNITEAVNKIRRTLPNRFHYFEVAKKVVDKCKELPINEESRLYRMAMGQSRHKSKKDRPKKPGKRSRTILPGNCRGAASTRIG